MAPINPPDRPPESSVDLTALLESLLDDPLLRFAVRVRPPDADQVPSFPPESPVARYFTRERIMSVAALLRKVPWDRAPGYHQRFVASAGGALFERLGVLDGTGEARGESHRQVGVIPSYRCSLGCPYCFNSNASPVQLTPRQICTALQDIGKTGGLDKVNFFGGEPLEYDGFEELLDFFEAQRLPFFLSTNGLGPLSRVERILRSPQLDSLTLHIEKPAFYGDRRPAIDAVVKRCVAMPDCGKLVVRYNFADCHHREWRFIADTMSCLPGARLSVAPVFPSPRGQNRYVRPEQFDLMARKIAAFAQFLIDELPFCGRAVLAKPFPLCLFTADELDAVVRALTPINACDIDRSKHTRQLMLVPGMKLIPCMALDSADHRIDFTPDLRAAGDYFRQALAPLYRGQLFERCGTCALFHLQYCQGACYSYLTTAA